MTAFTVYSSPSGDEVFSEGSTFKVQDNGVLTHDNRRRSAAHQFTECVAPLRSAGIATSTEATAKTVVPEK